MAHQRVSLYWSLTCLLTLAAFALSIVALTRPIPLFASVGAGNLSSINDIGPAGTGDFGITGDLGISIIADTFSVIVRNTATIALVEPTEFIVGGSPLSGSGGTITVTKAVQSAHAVWAGPTSGSAAVPTFRALVSTDVPSTLSLVGLTVSGDTVLGTNTTCTTALSAGCIPSTASSVLDNLATPTYPTTPQTQGVWYGPGAKAGCGSATSIAFGVSPIASAAHNIAVGNNATATSPIGIFPGAIAIGKSSISTDSGIAIGAESFSGTWGVAHGYFSTAGNTSITIGSFSTSIKDGSVAIGIAAQASGSNSIALGNAVSQFNFTTGIGYGVNGYAAFSILIGSFTTTSIDNSVVLGNSVLQGSSAFQRGFAGPIDTAHAFALNINNATVNPGTLGITVNNATYQLPLYSSDFATTATGATGGTTTLTVTSAKKQFFTGTTTQIVTLPAVSSLAAGFEFKISNLSTGAVTVKEVGGTTVATLAGTTAPTTKWGFFTCINVAGVGTAGWAYDAGA